MKSYAYDSFDEKWIETDCSRAQYCFIVKRRRPDALLSGIQAQPAVLTAIEMVVRDRHWLRDAASRMDIAFVYCTDQELKITCTQLTAIFNFCNLLHMMGFHSRGSDGSE